MSWPFYKSDTKVSSIISNLADVEKRWKLVDLFLCQCPGTELRFEGFSCYNKMDHHCDFAKGDAVLQKKKNTLAVTVSARRAMILADLILDGRTPDGVFKDCDTQFADAPISSHLHQDLPSPIKIDFPQGKTGTSCPMKDVKAPWPMTPSPTSTVNGKWDPAKSRRVELILTVPAGVQGKPKIDEEQCMNVQSTMSKNAQTTSWDQDMSCCTKKDAGSFAWCYVVKPMMRHHRGKHYCCPKQNCADLKRGPGGGKGGSSISAPAQTGGKCKWPPRKGTTEAGKDREFCTDALAKRFGGDKAKLCEKEGMRRACPEMCDMTCEKAVAQHESQASHDARKSDLSVGSTTASGIGVDGGIGGKVCCQFPGEAAKMYPGECGARMMPAPGKCGEAEGAAAGADSGADSESGADSGADGDAGSSCAKRLKETKGSATWCLCSRTLKLTNENGCQQKEKKDAGCKWDKDGAKCAVDPAAGQRFKTRRAAPGALRAAANDLEDMELPADTAEEAKSTASRKELLDIVKKTDTELHTMAGGRTTYEEREHGGAAGPAYEREFTQPHRGQDMEEALLEEV